MKSNPGPTFIIPQPQTGDARERNAFGVLKGFGKAYAEHYAKSDPKPAKRPQFVGTVVADGETIKVTKGVNRESVASRCEWAAMKWAEEKTGSSECRTLGPATEVPGGETRKWFASNHFIDITIIQK